MSEIYQENMTSSVCEAFSPLHSSPLPPQKSLIFISENEHIFHDKLTNTFSLPRGKKTRFD